MADEARKYDVTVVLLDDGYASTAIMPIEVFHSAGTLWAALVGENPEPRFKVTAASITGKPVRSPYAGLKMTPECGIAEIESTDIIVVPTSGLTIEQKLIDNHLLAPWLRKHHERGAYVAGACMGSLYLADAGLLDGRKATTHWAVAGDFARRYPKVDWRSDHVVTEDNRVLCSGGVMASADVSLYLVEKLCGHDVAVQTAKALLLNMPRKHQNGYALLPLSPPHEDDRVREIEAFLQKNYSDTHSTEDLAERAGMSPRTFVRRFKSATGRMPGAYLQAVRMEAAKTLLEHGNAPIQTVSMRVGYDDNAFFRSLFKRTTGMTPAEYRDRFAALDIRNRPQPH
ncbi:MAG TPA: helix-turn-helix domain-containing protein [Rhizomicrobium sp.]|nr:helix-turn-helix domain-containing protein [Rhizomicrobium sp.]